MQNPFGKVLPPLSAWIGLLIVASLSFAATTQPTLRVNVRDMGAAGDGKTKDTAAFQKALDAAATAGGTVAVPAGQYLIGSVVMGSNTTLQFEKDAVLLASPDINDYPIVRSRWEGKLVPCHRALIYADKADHIALVGPGQIVGNNALGPLRNPRAPVLFEPVECSDVRLDGFFTRYSRMWSIHPLYCDHIIATNLTLRSTMSNGDGIDVDSCQDVRIEHCDIDTGDDCIALKSGRGMEGVRIARPTRDVSISDCTLGSGFAGLAIGTEISGGVLNVSVQRCKFTRGANAIFLKSRTERGGFIINIAGDDLDAAATTFLGIDLIDKGIQDAEPVPANQGLTLMSNVRFTRVRVNVRALVDGRLIPAEKPLDHLELSGITGVCRSGITIANVNHAILRDVNVTGFTGELMKLANVSSDPSAQDAGPK